MKSNPECKKCGLLLSTVRSTSKSCLGGKLLHDFEYDGEEFKECLTCNKFPADCEHVTKPSENINNERSIGEYAHGDMNGSAGSTPSEKWVKEFNEKFVSSHGLDMESFNHDVSPKDVKDFISLVERRTIEDVMAEVEEVPAHSCDSVAFENKREGKDFIWVKRSDLLSTLRGLIK